MGLRKKLPGHLKDFIRHKQKGRCAICISRGDEFHHIHPVFLSGENTWKNVILLCYEHHKLVHLAHPETCMSVFEYAYYLHKGDLPDNPYSLITAEEVIELIKDDY